MPTEEKGGFLKEVRSQAIGLAITFLLPSVATGLAVVTGIAEKFGGPVVITFASIVFFFTMASVLMIKASKALSDVEHKLRYNQTIVAMDFAPDNRAAQAKLTKPQTNRTISKIQVGVQVFNAGHYPISAFVEMAHTNIEGHCPTGSNYPNKPVTIGPGNQVLMGDLPIEMSDVPCGHMKGRMDIKIKYGEKRKEKYLLEFAADIQVFMQPDGLISQVYTNWDTNQ